MKKIIYIFIFISICWGCKLDFPPFNVGEIRFSVNERDLSDTDELDILDKFAPVVYQNTRADSPLGYQFYRTGDFFIRVDFDGDWDSLNNWENCVAGRGDFRGFVYGSVVETESHWFLGYFFFHAMDDAFFEIDRHENDMETVFICIRKSDEQLEGMVTNKHGWDLVYSNFYESKGNIIIEDGRATVYISSNGSGIDFGHGIESWKGEGKHAFVFDLVRYRPELEASEPVVAGGKVVDAGYDIILLDDPVDGFWDKRDVIDNNPFKLGGGFGGDTYGAGAGPPWGVGGGHALINPVVFFSSAFPEIMNDEFSSLYVFNSYAKQ
ncbi:MAG: hypothetical protein JXR63_06825 [Spirochaetales bacterium]|nr:hypothetical protein [Spirochaetales bacterium]